MIISGDSESVITELMTTHDWFVCRHVVRVLLNYILEVGVNGEGVDYSANPI